MEETSISGNEPYPSPTATPEPLEIFEESDEANPSHVNYDFTKSEPFSIINDEEIIEKKVRKNVKRHYKLKK